MDLRFFFTLLTALTLVVGSAAAQDAPADPATDPATDPAETTGAAATDSASSAPAATSDDGAGSSSTSTASSATANGDSGTAAASGGAQPGEEFAAAPVIHEPVGTSSPVDPSAAPAAQAAPEEDDGRDADLLWIELGFGYTWVDLAAFSQNNFVPGVDQVSGSGYGGHAAAGLKIFLFTFGARGTVGSYPQDSGGFDIWSLMFDAMLRIPIFFLEPYVRAGIGYAWMGSVDYEDLGNSSVSVYGLTIEAGAGIDFYLGKYISLGAGFDVAFLNLTRQRVDNCGTTGGPDCDIGGVNFEEEGDAAGFQLRATGHAALHF